MAFPVTPTGFFGSGQSITYKIEQSLRFFFSNNDWFYRLPQREGDRKKFTLSFWIKRGATNQSTYLFTTTSGVNNEAGYVTFNSDDTLRYWDFRQNTNQEILRTTQTFRDIAAWYHIVLSVNYDNPTQNDRCIFYINGQRAPVQVNNQPLLSVTEFSHFNSLVPHYIHTPSGTSQRGDFYMAEVNFVDGQQLGPSSFGFFDKNTGMWMPTKYAGTYGENGYFLNFSNTTSISSLGYEYARTTTPQNTEDPFWNSTMLLVTCNGQVSGRNNTIVDSSNRTTVTPSVSVTQGTYSPFSLPTSTRYTSAYGGSVYLNETDFLQLGTTPNLNLGTGDWTIEFFVQYDGIKNFITLFNVDYDKFNLYRQDNGGGSGYQYFASIRDVFAPAGNRNLTTTSNSSNMSGRWEHVALVKSGGNGRLYVNGVNRTVGTDADFSGIDLNITNYNYTPWIGRRSTDDGTLSDYFMRGYISNFRIVSGVAVYTNDFTPPTGPLQNIDSTVTLLNFVSASISDRSAQSNIYLHGNTRVNSNISRFTTGSIELTGGPEYAFIPPRKNFELDTQDFTMECWFRFNTTPSNMTLMSSRNYFTVGFNGNWVFRITSSTQFGFYTYDGQSSVQGTDYTVPTMTAGTWYHVAVVRTNQSTRVYLNGIESSTGAATISRALNDGSISGIQIGRGNNNSPFNGYLDNIRISNTSRYTSNFVPPVSAFPSSGNKVYWNNPRAGGFVVNPSNFGGDADIFFDTPTSYVDSAAGRGNFCTWQSNGLNHAGSTTVTNGNLDLFDNNSSYWRGVNGTIGVSTGKWYWESIVTNNGGYSPPYYMPGFVRALARPTDVASTTDWYPGDGNAFGIGYYFRNGQIYDGGGSYTYGNTMNTGDIMGMALDLDNKRFFVSKNGVWQNSGDPVTGTNPAPRATAFLTTYNGETFLIAAGVFLSCRAFLNTGQRPFRYAIPAGYRAINTANIQAPVKKPISYFSTVSYAGNGSTLTVTMTGLSSIPFSAQANHVPDLLMIKNQSTFFTPGSSPTMVIDTVRGINRSLSANSSAEERTDDTGIQNINFNGFTVGGNTNYNSTLSSYFAWGWRRNTQAGFNIITYSGNGSTQTFNHNLGQVPNMVIIKQRNQGSNTQWWTWHKDVVTPNANWWRNYGRLQTTDSFVDWASDTGINSAPTDTTITIGNNTTVNGTSNNYIMYLWREIYGFSKFGRWTGNGNTTGPFIYCGFKPRWIMWKRTDGTSLYGWTVYDTSIDWNRYNNSLMNWTLLNTQTFGLARPPTFGTPMDILSNGFRLKFATEDGNAANSRYVFAAYAENPFKYTRGV